MTKFLAARRLAEPSVNIDVSESCAVPTGMAERRRIVVAENRRSASAYFQGLSAASSR